MRLLYVAMTRARDHLVLSWGETERSAMCPWPGHLGKRLGAPEMKSKPPRIVPIEGAAQINAAPPVVETMESLGQYDGTASVTSISQFQSCPRKYSLGRYLGLGGTKRGVRPADPEEEEERELDASALGTQVHQLLAGMEVPEAVAEALELAGRFGQSELGRLAAKAKRVEREYDLMLEMEDVILRGQIDLWFEHQGGIVIVDYKTDSVASPIDQARIEPYALQLQIYATALMKATGKPVRDAYLHFLKPNQAIAVDLSPLQLGAARQGGNEFRQAHVALQFPLRPGEQCLRCEFYRGLCPAGKKNFQVVAEMATTGTGLIQLAGLRNGD